MKNVLRVSVAMLFLAVVGCQDPIQEAFEEAEANSVSFAAQEQAPEFKTDGGNGGGSGGDE